MYATHVILGYKPISSSFQSPKYVIKTKDPRLKQINVAVLVFLVSPPPKGTHQVELPTQCITEEEVISLHLTLKEKTVKVIKVLDSEEDFEVFDQPNPTESPGAIFRHLPSIQVSNSQEPSNIPEVMVLQHKKNTSLLELLELHVKGFTPEVAVQPRAPTPLPTHTSPSKQPKKKGIGRRKARRCPRRVKLLQRTSSPRKEQKLLKGHKEKVR